MEKPWKKLQEQAAGLLVPRSRQAAGRHPAVRILSTPPSASDLDGIVRCSSGIFGSSERAQDGAPIWGEGWQCSWCGVKRPAAELGPCPSCGATERRAAYGFQETRRAFAKALRPRPDWHPVGCVLEREGSIVGYAVGAVTTRQHAAARLREKLGEDYRSELRALGINLSRIDLEAALPIGFPILYMEEVCIEAGARIGIESLQGLITVFLASAAELGARSLVSFTVKRSAAFRLSALYGAEISLELGPFVFFRCEDFLPIAALLHHRSADDLAGILARLSQAQP